MDITTYNGARTTFRRNQVSGNRPRRTPAVLREGARGRRFSQKNGYLPQRPPGKGLAQSSALYPQEVHGGSVSRRGHNYLQRRTNNFQAEPSQRKPSPPNASRSSGGSAREALLSEKRPPSHPRSPYCAYFFFRGFRCQIFSLYSRMVRSEENTPDIAVLVTAILSHLSRSA